MKNNLLNKISKYVKVGRAYSMIMRPDKKANAFPSVVMIEPTTNCNLKCVMCPRTEMKEHEIGNVDYNDYKRLIDEIGPKIQVVWLQGFGEPFLHKDIYKMIQYAKKYNLDVVIPSNFTLVNRKVAEEIVSSGIDVMSASVDSGDSENYRAIRHTDLKKVVGNIRTLIDVRDEMQSKTPRIYICCTVFNENISDLESIIKVATEAKVDSVTFKTATQYCILNKKIIDYDYKKLKESVARAKKRSEELGVKTNLDQFLESIETIEEKKGRYHENVPCYIPWLQTFISWTGNVFPCCDFSLNSKLIMGNVFEQDFETVWNNKKYKTFRRQIMNGISPHPICLSCNHYVGCINIHNRVLKARKVFPVLKAFKLRKGITDRKDNYS